MRRAKNIGIVLLVLALAFGVGYLRGRKNPPAGPIERYSALRDRARSFLTALPSALADEIHTRRTPAGRLPSGARNPVALGGDLRVNGMPISMSTYETDRSVEQVIAEARAGWTGDPKTIVTSVGKGTGFASRIDPETLRMTTVLAFAQPGGKTVVIPATTDPGAAQPERQVPDFPLQALGTTGFHLEATDFGKKSDTFAFSRGERPEVALQWVESQMRSAGWASDPKFQKLTRKRSGKVHSLFLTRGERECSLTVAPSPEGSGSHVVVVLSDGVE